MLQTNHHLRRLIRFALYVAIGLVVLVVLMALSAKTPPPNVNEYLVHP